MRILLYCPMLYHHDKGMWPPVISSTDYFLWQKNLWNVFQELKGWIVLWNAGQPNSNLYDPVQEWEVDNIKYTRMDIDRALKTCDKVLVDVPSTVMWDAKKANKSCLCISPFKLWIRADVYDELGDNMFFVSQDKVKGILTRWLTRQEISLFDMKDKFIKNENDWLKEITN